MNAAPRREFERRAMIWERRRNVMNDSYGSVDEMLGFFPYKGFSFTGGVGQGRCQVQIKQEY